MREQVRNPQATLAVLTERPIVFSDKTDLIEKRGRSLLVLQRLAVELLQLGFVIKRIDVTQPAHQHHVHHAFSTRGEMADCRTRACLYKVGQGCPR